MPEQKWYKGRPVRRTKKMPDARIKIIFDDGPPGQPGDTVYVTEEDYRGTTDGEQNVRRQFTPGKSAASTAVVTA